MSRSDLSYNADGAAANHRGELKRVALKGALLTSLFVGLWIGFRAVSVTLPYVQPGAKIIYDAKLGVIGRTALFPRDAQVRVAAFGNSRILSGFLPARFDAAVGHGCASFNFGLPDSEHFVAELERLIQNGDVPTHILIQTAWSSEDARSFSQWLKQDRVIINQVFPFRTLPRDLVVFGFLSRRRGGPQAFYRESGAIAEQVIRARGYYFIEGQSHYSGHRLPDDFSLPIDTPTVYKARPVATSGPLFEQLLRLVRLRDIQVLLIPDHFRSHAFREPPSINTDVMQALAAYPHLRQLGPDYVLFENRLFADAVHLNPEGAERYTDLLAELFKAHLGASGGSPSATERLSP